MVISPSPHSARSCPGNVPDLAVYFLLPIISVAGLANPNTLPLVHYSPGVDVRIARPARISEEIDEPASMSKGATASKLISCMDAMKRLESVPAIDHHKRASCGHAPDKVRNQFCSRTR